VSGFALAGLLIGLLALAFVLYPLLRPRRATAEQVSSEADLAEQRGALYQQILDVEFDQQLGKIDPLDAQQLTDSLLRQAAELLARQSERGTEIEELIEREIVALRSAKSTRRLELVETERTVRPTPPR
jgi:hypothetical protein